MLRCKISRHCKTDGPGFDSISPEIRRIKNIMRCTKKNNFKCTGQQNPTLLFKNTAYTRYDFHHVGKL
jgi:hypothetical protein